MREAAGVWLEDGVLEGRLEQEGTSESRVGGFAWASMGRSKTQLDSAAAVAAIEAAC
jgi:hypothetical protein